MHSLVLAISPHFHPPFALLLLLPHLDHCTEWLQASVRKGVFVDLPSVDVQAVGGQFSAFMLASTTIANAAPLPSFTVGQDDELFIGLQSSSGQPLRITPPHSSTATVVFALRWCTTAVDAFPSDLMVGSVQAVNTAVTLAGFSSDDDGVAAPAFHNNGSLLFTNTDTGRTCLSIEMTSTPFTAAVEYQTLEVQVALPQQLRRDTAGDGDGNALTFHPASPYAYAVRLQTNSTDDSKALTREDAGVAVAFEDLVAPTFLVCPPFLQDRTFTALPGETHAEVTLPVLNVYDAVDRNPTIEYPFQTKNLSAIGVCLRVSVFESLYACPCTLITVGSLPSLRLPSTQFSPSTPSPVMRQLQVRPTKSPLQPSTPQGTAGRAPLTSWWRLTRPRRSSRTT